MSLALPLYSFALFLAMALSLVLAVVAFYRLSVPGALAFFFGNLAAFFYSLGSLLEITSHSAAEALTALTLEYLGIATIGPLWFLTTISAAKGAWAVGPKQGALFFVVPALVILAVATNDYHHLFYTSIVLEYRGPFSVPALGKGPLYMVNMAYMNVFLFLGTLTAIQEAMRAPRAQRTALLILFTAGLVPWSGMVIYQLGYSPWGLDIAPFGITLSAAVFTVALFRFRLFDLMPLVIDQVFVNMKEGVMVTDNRGRLMGVNPAMTGILPDLSPDQVGRDLKSMAAAGPILLSGSDLALQVGGRRRVFQIDRSPLIDGRGQALGEILLFSDITQREELTARLSRMARTDDLTGLPNRRAFLERLGSDGERHRRHRHVYSVAIADLDHFKAINDAWGHEAGDAALVHVATLWSDCLRSSDLLARYGGEEFTLLLANPAAESRLLVERMRSTLEARPLVWKGVEIPMTASFGLATDESLTLSSDELIRRADEALYRAKEAGRNRIEGVSP